VDELVLNILSNSLSTNYYRPKKEFRCRGMIGL